LEGDLKFPKSHQCVRNKRKNFTWTGRKGFEPLTYGLRARKEEPQGLLVGKLDLKEFYEEKKEEFEKWLKNRIDPRTAEDYLKALDRYLKKGIDEPKKLEEVVKTQYVSLGLRNFLNFLEREYYLTELNGFSFDLWRKYLPTKVGKGKKKEAKIFLTDKDIKEAYKLIKEKWKDEATEALFKLLVFSGLRFEHAYKMLSEFDKRKLIVEGKIAMYPIEHLVKGKKKGYFAFMPAEFAKKLKKYDLLKKTAYFSRLQPSRWKPPEDNPVSAVRIRSWFQNFAIENGVRTEALRFIVGHSALTIGEAHYYNMRKIAKEEYSKIVDEFPIPP